MHFASVEMLDIIIYLTCNVRCSLVPRPTLYLVSSLLVLQLMSGLGVTMWGVFPTLTECWPWGKLACQVSPGQWSLISSERA